MISLLPRSEKNIKENNIGIRGHFNQHGGENRYNLGKVHVKLPFSFHEISQSATCRWLILG